MAEDAFRDLYDALYPAVLRFVRGAVSRSADVDDVVQEVFVRVARYYEGYRRQASLQTWVLAIARRAVVDYWRRQQRGGGRRAEPIDALSPGEEAALSAGFGGDAVRDPAEHTATNDELARIRACIETLPTNMRLVLLCRLYQDLTHTETAEVLGWTTARVRVTYSRAIRRFNLAWMYANDETSGTAEVAKPSPASGSGTVAPW